MADTDDKVALKAILIKKPGFHRTVTGYTPDGKDSHKILRIGFLTTSTVCNFFVTHTHPILQELAEYVYSKERQDRANHIHPVKTAAGTYEAITRILLFSYVENKI